MKGVAALLVVLVAAGVQRATALSTGAPPSTCEALLPKHGVPPQTVQSPFFVEARPGAPGDPVIVHLASREGFPYKGFLVQGRIQGSDQPVGAFSVGDPYKTVDCGGGTKNTVTHTNAALKNESVFEWTAPPGFAGRVTFNATIVQDYEHFWNNLTAEIQVGDGTRPSSGISTTQPPRTTARTSTTGAPATLAPTKALRDVHPIYQGCKSEKACFGYPAGCESSSSCSAMVAVRALNGKHEFEQMLEDGSDQYVAVGLSNDKSMGSDMVVECLVSAGRVSSFRSWNQGKRNTRVDQVQLKSSSYTNNVMYCKYELDDRFTFNNTVYDLVNVKYFLLLVGGPSFDQSIGKHKWTLASKQSDFLSNVNGFSPASKLLIKLHGAFMIGAWIGAASIGIVLARYFKQTWSGSQLCGKDLWFAWHRMFMILAWGLTIAGFVIIFIELGSWSQEINHAIPGVITTILAFFQPIFAAFRPHPDSRRRPIFNWLHWLVGNCAHILGIVSIFLAGQLGKAELPYWWIWILVGYVAFHVVMHLVFSLAGCISERQSGKKINSFPMREMSNSRTPLASAERKQEAPHSCFRKFLLALYILGILVLTIAIIIIVVLAPIEASWKQFLENF